MEEPTPLEELLRQVQSIGQRDSSGGFTMAAEKAREKLRQFQLADLHQYAVHLVAGAVAAGATWVRIEHRGSLLRLEADQPGLDAEDLQALFPSLLAGQSRPDLQALAIGLNAALALDPQAVTLIGWKGESGAGLELRPERSDQLVKLVSDPFPGPNPPRLRVLVQARRRAWRAESRELTAVAERCSWAGVHLLGNQRPLTQLVPAGRALAAVTLQGPQPLPGVQVQPRVSRRVEGNRQSVFVALGSSTTGCYVLHDGVRHRLAGGVDDILAVVSEPPGLSLSLSRELVENTALEEVREAVREAEQVGLTALEQDYCNLPAGEVRDRVRGLLLNRHREDVPLLTSAQGSAVSLRELREDVSRHGALFFTRRQEILNLAVPRLVIRLDPVCEPVLLELFPDHRSGDRFVEGNPFVDSNRSRWLQGPVVKPRLSGQFLVRVPLPDCPGEAGIPASPVAGRCQVRLLLQGRELATTTLPGLPGCLWAVAEPPGLMPNPTYDGVDPQPAMEQVERGLRAALPALAEGLLELLRCERPGHAPALAALELANWLPEHALSQVPWLTSAAGTRLDLRSLAAQTRELGYLPLGDDTADPRLVVSLASLGGLESLYRRALRRLFGEIRGPGRP